MMKKSRGGQTLVLSSPFLLPRTRQIELERSIGQTYRRNDAAPGSPLPPFFLKIPSSANTTENNDLFIYFC